MRSFVTSKNVKWCHLIWPTLYTYLWFEARKLRLAFKHNINRTLTDVDEIMFSLFDGLVSF